MRSLKTDVAFGAQLDVRELSFIKSFAEGSCMSSIYTPPVTAEFLRRITLKVSHGEVHGVVGSSGSGKSTLLKVISGRFDGKIDGAIWLNGQLLTRQRFAALCEYVDLNCQLLPNLTVEQTLHYHARLSLNCKQETVNYRVFLLMQQFDLGSVAEHVVNNLNKADTRRLVIAMHLVRDPVLVVIDDPLRGLDALSSFQLVSALQDYCKRQARMALISMKCPRSDVYQLLAQISLLFYGEIVYSGPTKQMPHYFNNIGFKCPAFENPAVYYLSLASVDRETPESYAETQSKAMKLAEIFREKRDSLSFLNLTSGSFPAEMPILSCFYGSPSNFSRLFTLTSRYLAYIGRSGSFVTGQMLLPLALLVVAVFGASLDGHGWHIPKSLFGSFFLLSLFSGLTGVWATVLQFSEMRKTVFFELSLGLYNPLLMLLIFVMIGSVLDVLSIGLAAFSFVWKVTDDVQLDHFLSVFGTIWCVYFFYKMFTLAVCICVDSKEKAFIFGTAVVVMMNVVAGCFLKSYQSFILTTKYLLPLTYISMERHTNYRMAGEFVNDSRVQNCSRSEFHQFPSLDAFCRWKTGSDYLHEIYPETGTVPEWWIGPLLLLMMTCVASVVFVLITKKCAQRKLKSL